MFEGLIPSEVTRLIVGLEPISMRWGAARLRTHCRDALKVEPDVATGFLFTNKTRDVLLFYCVDGDGDRVLQKKLAKGAFLLPAPGSPGAAFVSMRVEMLSRLFR